jgi:multidrug transporter EmrE-like cation transporter
MCILMERAKGKKRIVWYVLQCVSLILSAVVFSLSRKRYPGAVKYAVEAVLVEILLIDSLMPLLIAALSRCCNISLLLVYVRK